MSRDVVDLIMDDHRELERMFDEMRTDPDKRALLLPAVSSLLIAHSRAEEADVYPAAAAESDLGEDVEHGQEEHLEAELRLRRLQDIDPYDDEFDEALGEFVDAVTHHVEEEEETILPGMRQGLSAERRVELGEAFLATRADHLGAEAGELTRPELEVQAANLGVDDTAELSDEELQDELEDHADL